MHSGDRYSAGAVPKDAERARPTPGLVQQPAGQTGYEDRAARPARRRRWEAVAWVAGAAALFALFLRVSLTGATISDAANNALQAWDLLHGHLLLHGWIVGDASYYTFDLPLIAVVEAVFGLHTITTHVAVSLIYLIVAACAVALAVTGSRGASRAVRAAVVVAVLAAPALINSDLWIPLGIPDHTGTTVFLLVSCLLIDRAPARRPTAPLLLLLLAAGQLSDVTVRYVVVPAVVVVSAYRALAARKVTGGDAANLVAALLSVPLSLVVRAVMRLFGAYLMVSPQTRIAPVSAWPHNAALTWHSLRMLFGTLAAAGYRPAGTAAIFGFACMLVAAAGILRVLWRWRSAGRAEQALLVAIAVNIGLYLISTLPTPRTPHDLVAVLPSGAILGARALVPAHIRGRLTALAATGAAMVAALLPLSLVAARPPAVPPYAQLTAWLQAHRLSYGLGGYWDGSAVTLLSDDRVRVRTVQVKNGRLSPFAWETNTGWFDPARNHATFVIIDLVHHDLGPNAERFFGRPVSTHRVGTWEVFIYDKNVLRDVKPPRIPPTS